MPVYIQNFIYDLLAKGDVTVTTIALNASGTAETKISNLTFDQGGGIKGILGGDTTIFGYVNRLVKFARQDILIYINNILLTEIKPKPVYAIEYIPELPHEQVRSS